MSTNLKKVLINFILTSNDLLYFYNDDDWWRLTNNHDRIEIKNVFVFYLLRLMSDERNILFVISNMIFITL